MAAGAALVLGEPIKNAVCNVLSIFNLCTNNDALSRDVDNITRTQNAIVEILERVQTKNDKYFFVLGNKTNATDQSVRKVKKVVGIRFKYLELYLVSALLFLARFSFACDHTFVRLMHLLQAIRNYLYQMRTLYTHLKAYSAAFLALEISRFHDNLVVGWLLSRHKSFYPNKLPKLSRS